MTNTATVTDGGWLGDVMFYNMVVRLVQQCTEHSRKVRGATAQLVIVCMIYIFFCRRYCWALTPCSYETVSITPAAVDQRCTVVGSVAFFSHPTIGIDSELEGGYNLSTYYNISRFDGGVLCDKKKAKT